VCETSPAAPTENSSACLRNACYDLAKAAKSCLGVHADQEKQRRYTIAELNGCPTKSGSTALKTSLEGLNVDGAKFARKEQQAIGLILECWLGHFMNDRPLDGFDFSWTPSIRL
jgi:hypothetical protein